MTTDPAEYPTARKAARPRPAAASVPARGYPEARPRAENESMLNEWAVFGIVALICIALVVLLRFGLGDDETGGE